MGLLRVNGLAADQGETFTDRLEVKASSADEKTPVTGATVAFTATRGDASFAGGGQFVSATADSTGPAHGAGADSGRRPGR